MLFGEQCVKMTRNVGGRGAFGGSARKMTRKMGKEAYLEENV